MKTRIIVDSKRARTTAAGKRTHKSNLPKISGAVKSALGLLRDPASTRWRKRKGGRLEFLIADVSDAFWLVPLRKSERRYFVIKFKGKFLIFLRTAQGSRGAPLSWSVIASLLARVIQSLFCTEPGVQEARLNVYVDDPLLALFGDDRQRRRFAVKFVVGWLVLGAALAFSKAQLNHTVIWIGNTLRVDGDRIVVSIPETS